MFRLNNPMIVLQLFTETAFKRNPLSYRNGMEEGAGFQLCTVLLASVSSLL